MRLTEEVRRWQASARVGSTFAGKWHLDALLGIGGSSSVYAATHRNGARRALKLLDRAAAENPAMRLCFHREGYLANKLANVGAVRVQGDDVTEEGILFLVMELLGGTTLDVLASEHAGRLSAADVKRSMLPVLDLLASASAMGIVHGDIKPENIFRTDCGAMKLLDFGLASEADTNATAHEPTGTPAFMSPEQAAGERVDTRSDLYSVGATMFTLLSGELVHGDMKATAAMIAATCTVQVRSLAEAAPDVPRDLVAVTDRALRLKKSERWGSAEEMYAALSTARTTHQDWAGAWIGRVKQKVLPSPIVLSAQMRPPCPCTMDFEM